MATEGAISSHSTGIGRCPLAAVSMATRSGSSLGKWVTCFHDDETVGRAKLEESHLPHPWADTSHPQLRSGEVELLERWGGTIQTGCHHWFSLSPSRSCLLPLRLPQVQGSPGSSNTSVQMNVQVLCGEAAGAGVSLTTPLGQELNAGRPTAPLLAIAAIFSDVQGVRGGGEGRN